MNASEEGEPRMKWKRDRDGSGANLHRSETRDPPQSSLLIKLYNHVLLKLHNNHALLKKLSHQSCHQRSFKTFRHKKGRFTCIRIQIKESFSSKSLHQSWCRFNSGWSVRITRIWFLWPMSKPIRILQPMSIKSVQTMAWALLFDLWMRLIEDWLEVCCR